MPLRGLGQAEVGADIEKLVLDAGEHGVECGKFRQDGVKPRQANCGIGFIHGAEGLDAQVCFRYALAAEPRAVKPLSPVLV